MNASSLLAIPILFVVSPLRGDARKLPDPYALEYNYAEEMIQAFEYQEKVKAVEALQSARVKSRKEFRRLVEIVARENAGKPGYWANLWLASRGDRPSLLRLWHAQNHGGFEANSQEWSEAFHLWGVFKLYAASDFLVDWVSASNVLAGHGARSALKLLYPQVQASKFDWASETESFQGLYKAAIQAKRLKNPEAFLEQ
ncbi:hypothetical protein [Geothrix sp.]|uniref:hypothetical protein n=1 Tax=Geothrix sp. TaxID=1962974 RepID=UPI00262A42B1|nr:hypothetical protein [Geothrix sp.]WIL19804.1 MAG: hypothetical protein QOZ81_002337 [Geothrix sp.]